MLSANSHIRVRAEQTRVEVVRWLAGRWVDVKREDGFDELEGWSLKELSHGEKLWFSITDPILMRMDLSEIGVSIDELFNHEIPEPTPDEPMAKRKIEQEKGDSRPLHLMMRGAGKGTIAKLKGVPANGKGVHASVIPVVSSDLEPIPKPSSILPPTQTEFSPGQNNLLTSAKIRTRYSWTL